MTIPRMLTASTARGGDFFGRRSLAWRLALPVPLILIVALALTWWIVPRIVESMATNDAFLANKQVASEFKTIRESVGLPQRQSGRDLIPRRDARR
jgi:hypothetical protein